MKRKNMIAVAAIMLAVSMAGCSQNSGTNTTDATKILTEVKSAQYFTDEKISNEDVEKILAAGVNAPSAMNTQPWHFTAITDEETTQKLADAMGNMKPPAGMPAPGEKPEGMPERPEGMPEMPAPGGNPGFFRGAKAGIGDAPLTIVISCEDGEELSAGLAVQNMSAQA